MTDQYGLMRKPARALLCLIAACALGGCRHKMAPATRPPVLQAPDAQPVTPDSPGMVSPPPTSVSTAPTIKVTQARPRRVPKKSTSKAPQPSVSDPVPPAEIVSAPTAESSIGELSAGGDSSPKTQEASALIASCEGRATQLSQSASGQSTIRKARYFLTQAKQALGSGDAEGALTLATKAKLLLDDLVKETK